MKELNVVRKCFQKGLVCVGLDHKDVFLHVKSRKDMLATIMKSNERHSENPAENVSILSMDAEALFPSLDIGDMLQAVWNLIMNSDVTFCNIDVCYMAKYLNIMYTREVLAKCNVISCIPRRQTEIDGISRAKPGIAFLDSYYKL